MFKSIVGLQTEKECERRWRGWGGGGGSIPASACVDADTVSLDQRGGT